MSRGSSLWGDLCWGRGGGGGGLGWLVWGGGGVSGGGCFLRGEVGRGGKKDGGGLHFAVLCVRGSVLVGSNVVWSCSGLLDL